MIAELRRYGLVLRAAIFVLPPISFVAAAYISVHWMGVKPGFTSAEYLYLGLFTMLVWSIVAEREEVTSIAKVSAENTGLRASFAACGITYLVDLVVLFLVHELFYSRVFVVLSAVILLILTVSVRTLFRILLQEFTGRRPKFKVIIVGVGSFAARVAKQVQHNEFVRCRVMGYIQCPDEEISATNAPVFQIGDLDALEKLEVDSIMIAVPPQQYGNLQQYISKLQVLGKPIRVIVNAGNGTTVKDRVIQLGRLQMLDLDPSPTSSLGYSLVKRGFDIGFAAAALAIFSLPMFVISLVIKLTSHGPVFFRQQRVGRNGQLFTMYKFRTMKTAPASDGDTRWTAENDPRRTRVGIFLRKTSLDELPQFFNVLKGDMSVVGPRPERPHYVRKFGREIALYQTRHQLNVGITGWAQVHGLRGDTSIRRRIRYDLYYLQHWSLLFDIRIILMTVWGGFMGKNAY
jgi:Undecaprenyl-phosphate glucose phosphotransferase